MKVSLDRERKLVVLRIDKHKDSMTVDEWNSFKNRVDEKISKSHRF